MSRAYTFLDRLLISVDVGLKVLSNHLTPKRDNPGNTIEKTELLSSETKKSIALMRVNHAGEIAAQALYQGQALFARSEIIKNKLLQASEEEIDHLSWCHERIQELDGHTSYLNPLWYVGSLAIGAVAGLAGDDWSLGFLAETEKQVEQHLQTHLQTLPSNDHKSKAIIKQMEIDETKHATAAIQFGARELPFPIKHCMKFTSKMMTTLAYWI